MKRAVLAAVFCGALCACTTVDPGKSQTAVTYFGIVRIESPAVAANNAAPVAATDTRAVGLRLQDGLGLGYFHDQSYQVPADCRIVVFVQSKEQLDELSRQLAGFKEGICGTVKSS